MGRSVWKKERGRDLRSSVAMRGMMAVLMLLAAAAPAYGQVAWGEPLMVAPSTPAGWGVYLIDPAPGSGVGVVSTWRSGGAMGYRIGIAEDEQQNVAVFGGLDVSGELLRVSADIPVDVDWVTGVGLGVGDGVFLSFPLGISVGRELQADDVWFNPYLTPRVLLDVDMGDRDSEMEDDELSLGIVVDVGLDVSFDPGWAVRFAGSFGSRRALAIGISFRVL